MCKDIYPDDARITLIVLAIAVVAIMCKDIYPDDARITLIVLAIVEAVGIGGFFLVRWMWS